MCVYVQKHCSEIQVAIVALYTYDLILNNNTNVTESYKSQNLENLRGEVFKKSKENNAMKTQNKSLNMVQTHWQRIPCDKLSVLLSFDQKMRSISSHETPNHQWVDIGKSTLGIMDKNPPLPLVLRTNFLMKKKRVMHQLKSANI